VRSKIHNPHDIMNEARKRMDHDTTSDTFQGYLKIIADLERQQANLSRALARESDDDDTTEVLMTQLRALSRQKQDAKHELAILSRRQREWKEAQRRIDNMEAWLHGVAAYLPNMSYEEKRIVLYALNVQVIVRSEGQNAPISKRCSLYMGNEHAQVAPIIQ